MEAFSPKTKISTDKKHLDFFRKAFEYSKNSDDPKTKVGALLVDDKDNIIEYGCNHFVKDVKKLPERLERPLKYDFIVHAERDIIFKCAKKGISTNNLIMYLPWFPCSDCAMAIASSGIKRLVYHNAINEIYIKNLEKWKISLENALAILEESGVEVILAKGKIGNVKGFVDGKEIEP